MAAFGTMYFIPIYIQLRGGNAAQAGLRFIPQAAGNAVGAVGAGYFIKRTGNYVYFTIVSHIFLLTSSALNMSLSWNTPSWCPFAFLDLTGLGFGGILATTMVALISSVDQKIHAVATSASFAFRAIGSYTGLSVASAIFQNVLRYKLEQTLNGEDVDTLIEKIRQNFDVIWELPPDVQAVVQNSYTTSLTAVFIAIMAMSTSSLVCSLFMKQNMLYSNLNRR